MPAESLTAAEDCTGVTTAFVKCVMEKRQKRSSDFVSAFIDGVWITEVNYPSSTLKTPPFQVNDTGSCQRCCPARPQRYVLRCSMHHRVFLFFFFQSEKTNIRLSERSNSAATVKIRNCHFCNVAARVLKQISCFAQVWHVSAILHSVFWKNFTTLEYKA